ncbi:hypothetical protein DW748_18955 [Ruminococcus sp. AM28-41]|jgi:flagellar motility protein MotE (MotC chaperone)|uniref:hypothetical protein n=1 Tax=Blautia wexlerae TaxID=418240 RepID=UPI000E552CB1|nr:hypothetical protein [Blautia wexlerae]MDB6469789.1 hypothetical protein [Blautia wexlerae]RHT60099.1 hypothetical protein DW748_18955 [Ruminococcus sp. AM28-41]
MDNFQEQMKEIEQLKAEQALHRKQLEENRQRALAKQKQTRRLVSLGKMVEKLLPDDIANLPEDEILEILKNQLSSKPFL